MLKAFAIGDLHLKFVNGVDKRWQETRYLNFIDHIVERCLENDALLIIAGDTLDSINPKKEEVRMLMYMFHQLNKSNVTTLLVSGNHETIKTGSSILDYMELDKFPNVWYRDNYHKDGVTFHLVNHDELTTHKHMKCDGCNVLVSHFRCNYNQFVTEEIDVEKFTASYDLCIVGDIHDGFTLGKIWYTNNAVNKEFDTHPKCGYLEITKTETNCTISRIESSVPSLRYLKLDAQRYAKIKGSSYDMGNDFYKIEVEGTPEELRGLTPLHNSILKRVPLVPNVLNLESTEEVVDVETGDNDSGLVGYMTSLSYSDKYVAEMMKELRRNVD